MNVIGRNDVNIKSSKIALRIKRRGLISISKRTKGKVQTTVKAKERIV